LIEFDGVNTTTFLIRSSGSPEPYFLTNINGTLFYSADLGDGNGHQVWIAKGV